MANLLDTQFNSLCNFLGKRGVRSDLKLDSIRKRFSEEWKQKPYYALGQSPEFFASFFNCEQETDFELAIYLKDLGIVLDCMLTPSFPGRYGVSRNHSKIKDGSDKTYSEKSLIAAIQKSLNQTEKLLQMDMPIQAKNEILKTQACFKNVQIYFEDEKQRAKQPLRSSAESFQRLLRIKGPNPIVELIKCIIKDLKKMNCDLRWTSYFTVKASENIYWTYETIEDLMAKLDFSDEDGLYFTDHFAEFSKSRPSTQAHEGISAFG